MSPVCVLSIQRWSFVPGQITPPCPFPLLSCPLFPAFVSLPLFPLWGKQIFIVLRTWCWSVLGRYWSLQDLLGRNRSLKVVLKGIVPGPFLSAVLWTVLSHRPLPPQRFRRCTGPTTVDWTLKPWVKINLCGCLHPAFCQCLKANKHRPQSLAPAFGRWLVSTILLNFPYLTELGEGLQYNLNQKKKK